MAEKARQQRRHHLQAERWPMVRPVSLSGRRVTKYAKSQKACRDWVKAMLNKIEHGLTFDGTQVSLQQFMESWLAGKELSAGRPQSRIIDCIVRITSSRHLGKCAAKHLSVSPAPVVSADAGRRSWSPNDPARPCDPAQCPQAGGQGRPDWPQSRRGGRTAESGNAAVPSLYRGTGAAFWQPPGGIPLWRSSTWP